MSAKRPRPRTKPLEERRDDLMNAAQELFLKHGVGPTTIDQITSVADVAKGTFYLYFESKEDVLLALRDRFRTNFLIDVENAVSHQRDDDWAGKLRAWVRTAVGKYLDAVALHDLLFHGGHRPGREKLRDNKAIAHLANVLTAGTAAKAWAVERPQEVAVFLMYGVHGVIDLSIVNDKAPNKRHLTQTAEQFALRIVALPGETAAPLRLHARRTPAAAAR
jgi:AcrR family transcriptional regulator